MNAPRKPRAVVEIRSRKTPESGRFKCFISNIWFGVWALWDGSVGAGEWGWRMAPRFGPMIDLLSGYTLPMLFAGAFSAVGSVLGVVSCFGCLGESLLQLFIQTPYPRPISRVLIDWVPGK